MWHEIAAGTDTVTAQRLDHLVDPAPVAGGNEDRDELMRDTLAGQFLKGEIRKQSAITVENRVARARGSLVVAQLRKAEQRADLAHLRIEARHGRGTRLAETEVTHRADIGDDLPVGAIDKAAFGCCEGLCRMPAETQ